MRDVLVHMHAHDRWGAGAEAAAALARRLQARLNGVYVGLSSLAWSALEAPEVVADLYTYMEQQLDEAAAAAPQFLQRARDAGIERASWRVAGGPLDAVLASACNWNDVLVVERRDDSPWGRIGGLGALVMECAVPCLVVPPKAPAPGFERIAVASHGAPEAVRAVRAALPLLQRATHVVLIEGRREAVDSALEWRPPFDLGDDLQAHGVRFERVELDVHDHAAGAALEDVARAQGAQLLVMGAYGRGRLSEWLLGGATRHLLQHARLPLLLRH